MTQDTSYVVTFHGDVQRIGLRKRVQGLARERGLRGWIRNQYSGQVVALFEGAKGEILDLLHALQKEHFPDNITGIDAIETATAGLAGFEVIQHPKPGETSISMLDAFRSRMRHAEAIYRDSNTAVKTAHRYSKEYPEVVLELLAGIPPRFRNEAFGHMRWPFGLSDNSASFASELWGRRKYTDELKRAWGFSPESFLNTKETGMRFAEYIGIKCPRIYQRNVPFEKINVIEGTVIKPASSASSRGVYCIKKFGDIISLYDNERFSSVSEMKDHALRFLSEKGKSDLWIVEDWIRSNKGEIPNDIKMYAFYGEVALVQEEERLPKNRFAFYDTSGKQVRTGRYEDRAFSGSGFSKRYLDLSKMISLEIPAPFMRIDFLKSDDGPVFCEFTPKPGNFHTFNDHFDRLLGSHYVSASARLFADVLAGKSFEKFFDFADGLRAADAMRRSA